MASYLLAGLIIIVFLGGLFLFAKTLAFRDAKRLQAKWKAEYEQHRRTRRP